MPKVFIIGEGAEPKEQFGFDLNQLQITIGRAPDNNIIIAGDTSISSHHCVIHRVLGGYTIVDLNSNNGTKQNGKRITTEEVSTTSIIHAGLTEIRFTLSEEEITLLKREPKDPNFAITEALLPEIHLLQQGEIDTLSIQAEFQQQAAEIETPAPAPASYQEVPQQVSVQPSGINRGPAVSNSFRPAPTYQEKKPNSIVTILLAIIFIVVGLIGGLWIRHNKDYSQNLFKDISEKKFTKSPFN